MDNRPLLDKHISIQDFKDFYWYKEDLVQFCRAEGLDKQGSKIELSIRIEKFLSTGERSLRVKAQVKKTSRFDWNTEPLTLTTIITDNYKNTENVRAFFTQQIGRQFKFNVKFMNWMKTAEGKTLGDAVDEWKHLSIQSKKDKSPKDIAPQFEYNTYMRDYLKDNPTMSRDQAILCWKAKKQMRGDNKYKSADLDFIK